MSTINVEQEVSGRAAEREHDFQVADAILAKVAPSILDASRTHADYYKPFFAPDDWATLDEICLKLRQSIVGEIQRHKGVQRFGAMAETAAARKAARKRLEAATAAKAKSIGRIEAEETALRNEKLALVTEESEAQAVVDRQAKGVELLRNHAPRHIKEKHNIAMKALKVKGAAATDKERAEVDAILDYYGK